ncbi:hypothetical protein [Breznakia pachnodae]|uniref:PurR-regulated permease PerM n=1 Tax=Breznakia pachnodae TaxID=265178 RepID=A0ABU0E561_9FIRM|nr:hypothetical protein [Breznakia pachnodae]MDQ0362017.1 putative PurR-regulated permease PerM [Breznakia pachnodae]
MDLFKKKGSKHISKIIILLIVFVFLVFIIGALTIRQSVDDAKYTMKKELLPVSTVSVDYANLSDKVKDGIDKIDPLDEEFIHKIADLEFVDYYDYHTTYSFSTKELKSYYGEEMDEGFFELTGVEYPNIMDVEEGIMTLVDGRTFSEVEITNGDNVVVVAQEFAQLNKLSVGSTFKFSEVIYEPDVDEEGKIVGVSDDAPTIAVIERELKVTGIVKQMNPDQTTNKEWQTGMKENVIYCSNKLITNIEDTYTGVMANYGELPGSQDIYIEPIFVLKDNSMLNEFKEEVNELIPEYYMISDTSNALNEITTSIDQLNSNLNIGLYIAIGFSLIMLCLLMIFILKRKRQDIVKNNKISSSALFKVTMKVIAIIIAVATLAIPVGTTLGNKVLNDTVTTQQIPKENDYESSYGYSIQEYVPNYTTKELTNLFDDSFEISAVLIFYGITVILCLISTMISGIFIFSLKK